MYSLYAYEGRKVSGYRNFNQGKNFLEELIERLIFSLIVSVDRPIRVACFRSFERMAHSPPAPRGGEDEGVT